MVQIIRIIFNFGEYLRNKLYETDEEDIHSFLIKLLILTVTIANFSLSLYLVYCISHQNSPLFIV